MPHPQSPLSEKQLASLPNHSLNLDGEPTIPTAPLSAPSAIPLPAQTHKNSSPSPRVRHPLSLFPCNPQHLKNLRHARKFLGARPRASPCPENVQTPTILLGV